MTARPRIRAAVISALAVLLLAACGNGNSHKSAPASITVSGIEPEAPLTPAEADISGGILLDQLFAGLITYDAEGKIVYEVAAKITSKDFKRWTITLNTGWTFTDGSAVTAESFVTAWNAVATGKDEQRAIRSFGEVAGFEKARDKNATLNGIKVKSDTKIELVLSEPDADFVRRLGHRDFYPLPKAATEDAAAFADAPIGNGPYQLAGKDAWQRGESITLQPNRDYEGARQPKNGGLTFRFYPDTAKAYQAVQSNDLDVLDTVPTAQLKTMAKDPKVQAFTSPGPELQSLVIPEFAEHFGGKEGRLRRRALSGAIDRETIIRKALHTAGSPAVDFTSPLMPGFRDGIAGAEVLKYDSARAKRDWKKANAIAPWKGTLRLAFHADSGDAAWIKAVAKQLSKELGIKVRPKRYRTFEKFSQQVIDRKINGAFRMLWQPDYPSMLNYLQPRFATGVASNVGDYSSSKVDAALRKAHKAGEADERWDAVTQAQEVLLGDLPAVPLWYSTVAAAVANEVTGVRVNWQGNIDYWRVQSRTE